MNYFGHEKKTFIQQYRPLLILLILMLLATPVLIYKTVTITRNATLDAIRKASAHTLSLVVENLNGELARFRALPHLLTADSTYRKLWDKNRTKSDLHQINLLLEKNKNITGALDLYIMDKDGTTIAASNWSSPRTFIGRNFGFRPYFRQAMQGSLGRYFALGATSRQRGYYFSYPIRDKNRTLGVMVAKIKVGHFETAWKNRQNDIMVTDNNGIVFLSSNHDWLFRSLAPLSAETISRIRSDRQYGKTAITPLGIIAQRPLGKNVALVELETRPASRRTTGRKRPATLLTPKSIKYMQLEREMKNAGWRVHILARTDIVHTQIWRNAIIAGLVLFALFTGLAFLLERFRRNRERIEMQSRARAELERRVEERTLELQQAQNELIQAGKLAALGKLSAGLSHELNQPLAAIRSYSDNAATLLQRGLPEPAANNLKNISELTDRMARIIKHLRTYASKDRIEAGPTDVVFAVHEAMAILAHRISKEKVSIVDELPKREVIVHGGAVRLQQVFVNILSNAFDAVSTAPLRKVFITLEEHADRCAVIVCDTGQGLGQAELDRAFDPFFSTKEVGKGVGLGLSISYGIIQQFGGHIEIGNCDRGGAFVKVDLPTKAKQPGAAARKRRQKEKTDHV